MHSAATSVTSASRQVSTYRGGLSCCSCSCLICCGMAALPDSDADAALPARGPLSLAEVLSRAASAAAWWTRRGSRGGVVTESAAPASGAESAWPGDSSDAPRAAPGDAPLLGPGGAAHAAALRWPAASRTTTGPGTGPVDVRVGCGEGRRLVAEGVAMTASPCARTPAPGVLRELTLADAAAAAALSVAAAVAAAPRAPRSDVRVSEALAVGPPLGSKGTVSLVRCPRVAARTVPRVFCHGCRGGAACAIAKSGFREAGISSSALSSECGIGDARTRCGGAASRRAPALPCRRRRVAASRWGDMLTAGAMSREASTRVCRRAAAAGPGCAAAAADAAAAAL